MVDLDAISFEVPGFGQEGGGLALATTGVKQTTFTRPFDSPSALLRAGLRTGTDEGRDGWEQFGRGRVVARLGLAF